MTFNATTLTKSLIGDMLRFKRKNSYIDIPLKVFEQIATINGGYAIYTCSVGSSESLILRWNVRKQLIRGSGTFYNGMFCLVQDIPYLQQGRISETVVNDIKILTKLAITPKMQDDIISIIRTNFDIIVYKVNESGSPASNTVSFSTRGITDKSNFELQLRSLLNSQLRNCNLFVKDISSKSVGTSLIYRITFEIGD